MTKITNKISGEVHIVHDNIYVGLFGNSVLGISGRVYPIELVIINFKVENGSNICEYITKLDDVNHQ